MYINVFFISLMSLQQRLCKMDTLISLNFEGNGNRIVLVYSWTVCPTTVLKGLKINLYQYIQARYGTCGRFGKVQGQSGPI